MLFNLNQMTHLQPLTEPHLSDTTESHCVYALANYPHPPLITSLEKHLYPLILSNLS